jgi:hypothetical protein
MALVKCKECGAVVSTNTQACPGCGAKPKKPLGAAAEILIGVGALIVISIIFAALTKSHGTATSQPAVPRPRAQQGGTLEPVIKAILENPSRPIVIGETNLPDDTSLLITISRKEASYRASDKVVVRDGRFRTTQFSQKGKELNPGTYSVELVMPVAGGQPASVRAVIGDHGEKLIGPTVKHNTFGRFVKQYVAFKVGGSVNEEADRRAREQQQRDIAEHERKSKRELAQMLALNGAQHLKSAMKDPDSFELKRATLMTDGTVCYGYRARNSFNAMLRGSAVLVTATKKVEMLVQEQHGNRFVAAWKKRCAARSGEDITSLLNISMR